MRWQKKRRVEAERVPAEDLSALHWMAAGLFVAAGAESALGERRGDYRGDEAIRWAPMVAAPLAGAAQIARALAPGATTRMIAQLVNGVALGVGAAGLANSIHDALHSADDDASLRRRMPSLAPLAFGAVGLLGLLLDAEEADPPRRRKVIVRV